MSFNLKPAFDTFNNVLDAGDMLWMNVLDKMNTYAPYDQCVRNLAQWMKKMDNFTTILFAIFILL